MFIKVNFIELFICYIYLVFFCSFVPHKPWLLHTSLYVILCDNTDDRLLIFYTCCISHALFSVKILIVQLNEVISPNSLLLAKLSFNQWALCLYEISSCVVQSLNCVQLCDPADCSTPDSSVLRCVPEFAQIHLHLVGDAV